MRGYLCCDLTSGLLSLRRCLDNLCIGHSLDTNDHVYFVAAESRVLSPPARILLTYHFVKGGIRVVKDVLLAKCWAKPQASKARAADPQASKALPLRLTYLLANKSVGESSY